MPTRHLINFHDAMTLCLLGVLLVAGILAWAANRLEPAARAWYLANNPAPRSQPRPWFVRFYEFVNH
jgi:hypothetical protein